MEPNNSQPSIDRIGPWLILIAVGCGLLVLASDFLSAVVTVLSQPNFLSGFGLMMLQIGVVSALGVGAGLALAELALCNEWLTQSMIRFLRLGRWLPFFVVWAAPIWWIRWSKHLAAPPWTETIFQVGIAMFPTVLFMGCYSYLFARHTLQVNRRTAVFTTLTSVLSEVLLLAFLLQVILFGNGWQWFAQDYYWIGRLAAAGLLVSGCSFLLHWISDSGFTKTAEMSEVTSITQLRYSSWRSSWGAALLWLICFALWDRLFVLIRDVFTIPPIRAVTRAGYRLLTSGSVLAHFQEPLWPHVAASAQELAEGLLLSGIVAFIAAKILRGVANSAILSSGLFAVTHAVLILPAIFLLPWIGVGHWFKAASVAALSFLPLLQSLWGLRDQPLTSRILLALDNALPYAFLGMLFGEMYAATAGLGFFIVMARAQDNRTEALATSLITFGLLVAVSLALRFAAKIVSTSPPEAS